MIHLYHRLMLLNAEFLSMKLFSSKMKAKDKVAKGILTRLLTSSELRAQHRYEAHLQLITISARVSFNETLKAIKVMTEEAQQCGDSNIVVLAAVMGAELEDNLDSLSHAEALLDNAREEWAQALQVRLLTRGVLLFTRLGRHQNAAGRLTKLHAILDAGKSSEIISVSSCSTR